MYENYLDRAARDLSRVIGIDPHYARWETIPELRGTALVLHLPWSRVVVARTATGAAAFGRDFKADKTTWLLDSLHTAYPVEGVPALPPSRLLEVPVTDRALSGFLRWGIRCHDRATWPVSRSLRVVGSWTSYRDAVLVRHRGGRMSVRLRAPTDRLGDLNGKAIPRQDSGAVPAQVDRLHGPRSTDHRVDPDRPTP